MQKGDEITRFDGIYGTEQKKIAINFGSRGNLYFVAASFLQARCQNNNLN